MAATLELRPEIVQEGTPVLIAGEGWPLEAIAVTIDGKPLVPAQIHVGAPWQELLVPDPNGAFLIEVSTLGIQGRFIVVAESKAGEYAKVELVVEPRVLPGKDVPRSTLDKPFLRNAAFRRDRIGNRIAWPRGFTQALREDWIRKHQTVRETGGGITFIAPVRGVCNWIPLGPAPYSPGKALPAPGYGCSGRLRSIAIDPHVPSRMYVGAATGGLWKSIDGGQTFVPKTDDKFSLAIGAIAVDPTPGGGNVIYAGTGEQVPLSNYYYYGRGLLKSTDFGETWAEIGATDFDLAEIARIVINPLDSANVFVAASNGLWESTNAGASWTRIASGICTDVVLVQNPATPTVRKLLAGFVPIGGARYALSTSGGPWTTFMPAGIVTAPAGSKRIVFGVCRTRPNVVYAAFAQPAGGDDLVHIARSDDWGVNWTPRSLPTTGGRYAASYNLAIQPHPDDPETVLLAVSSFYKSTDGGGSWTDVTGAGGRGIHVDNHVIAFHPTMSDRVFIGCDGGLFVSNDVCATWENRNTDLATLQLYDIGQHREYESILIGGSQDNGGFHYSGAPIWKTKWTPPDTLNIMGGDCVVAQIDPHDPYIHYHASAASASSQMRRSNDGGATNAHSWTNFPGTQWWIPFAPHPSTAGVVFQGAIRVMRSHDRGGTWEAITNALAAPVRAFGFHPTNPRVLYAGTTAGHVYRLTGPAAGAWDTTTVTTENVTLTGLPAGVGVSSIAVDTTGVVWVTISALLETEGTGELTNHHVYRLDAGATAWAMKSDGLVVANPINTIVIDPENDRRLFCGGDRGVYSWDHATQRWSPMDEGLPSAPVMKLVIHRPSRKLRAATFGRGLWERPVDGFPFSDHFLYFRDNLVDSGATPSPDGVPHPYIRGERCWHWQSEDIVVDPSMQTPAMVTNALELSDTVVHRGARRGTNRVYVTVHNKGPFAVTNVRVRAYFARASAGLPPFPAGLLASPFTWTVPAGTTPDWTPVDGTMGAFPIPRIEPGTTRLAYWNLVIPPSAPAHSCLLAFITSAEDPFGAGGITDPDALVMNNRKVTLRNLDLDAPPPPGGSGSGSGSGGGLPPGSTEGRTIWMHGRAGQNEPTRVVVFCANVPREATILVDVEEEMRPRFRLSSVARSARADEIALRSGGPGIIGRVAKRGAEIPIGEIDLPPDRPLRVTVWMHAEEWDAKQRYGFDVVQMQGGRAVGGYSVRIGE